MKAKASPGLKVPIEGKPREYITDEQFVDLPETAYYNRLVRDGSLVKQKPTVTTSPPKQTVKTGGKK